MHRNKFRRIEKEEEENKKHEKKSFAKCYLSGTRQRSYLLSALFLALGKEIVFPNPSNGALLLVQLIPPDPPLPPPSDKSLTPPLSLPPSLSLAPANMAVPRQDDSGRAARCGRPAGSGVARPRALVGASSGDRQGPRAPIGDQIRRLGQGGILRTAGPCGGMASSAGRWEPPAAGASSGSQAGWLSLRDANGQP